jgi:hypothetical protein
VIRHDNKSDRFDNVLIIDQLKPIVNQVVGVCDFEEGYPVITGEGNEPGIVVSRLMFGFNGHKVNIRFPVLNPQGSSARDPAGLEEARTFFHSRGVSHRGPCGEQSGVRAKTTVRPFNGYCVNIETPGPKAIRVALFSFV